MYCEHIVRCISDIEVHHPAPDPDVQRPGGRDHPVRAALQPGNPVIGTIVLLVGLLAGLYMVIANIRRLIYGQQWTTPRDIVAILRGLRAKERDHHDQHDQHDAGLDLVADHDPTRERHA